METLWDHTPTDTELRALFSQDRTIQAYAGTPWEKQAREVFSYDRALEQARASDSQAQHYSWIARLYNLRENKQERDRYVSKLPSDIRRDVRAMYAKGDEGLD